MLPFSWADKKARRKGAATGTSTVKTRQVLPFRPTSATKHRVSMAQPARCKNWVSLNLCEDS